MNFQVLNNIEPSLITSIISFLPFEKQVIFFNLLNDGMRKRLFKERAAIFINLVNIANLNIFTIDFQYIVFLNRLINYGQTLKNFYLNEKILFSLVSFEKMNTIKYIYNYFLKHNKKFEYKPFFVLYLIQNKIDKLKSIIF